jgi:hypothetical protein
MSVQTLPRWQRALLRWFLDRKIRKNNRPLPCPQCQGHVPLPHRLNDAMWDMLVTCPHCGHAASLMDFAADHNKTPEEKLAAGRIATTPPVATRITVEDTGSSRTWILPAKGGWNPLLGFGTIWFLFSSVFFAIFLFGNVSGIGNIPAFLLISAFLLIGVGLIYGGLGQSFSHHVLNVDAVELVHERRMFGNVKRKALPREDISSVELVVFYSENYKPVHGIEIKAGRRKIRFGSRLTPEEKAWLCEELRHAVSLRHTAARSATHSAESLRDTSSVLGTSSNPRVEVNHRGHGCVVRIAPGNHGKHVLVMGCIFVAVATFMIVMGSRMWLPPSEGAPLPFMLLWNGFCLFWCGGVSIFGFMGLAVMIAGWRMNRTSFQITATPDALQILESCGLSQHETLVPASEVQDIRTGLFQTIQSTSGNESSTETQHRGIIVLSDRVVGFGGGCSLHELNRAVTALNTTLGRTAP